MDASEISRAGAQVRWDWDGDGVWDTSWTAAKTARHQYAASGTYAIRLEVRNTRGFTDIAARQILVLPDTRAPEIIHGPPIDVFVG